MFRLARPYAAALAFASLVLALQAGITLLAPRLAAIVVDAAVLEGRTDRLNSVVALLLALFALRAILVYIQLYLLRATGARLLRDLRDRLFGHALLLGTDFFETRRVGELLSRLGSDLERVGTTLTSSIPDGLRATLTLVGTVAFVFAMNAELAAVALVALVPIPVLARLVGSKLQRLTTRVQDSLAEAAGGAEEALAGIRTVQAFDRTEHEVSRYRRGLAALLGVELHSAQLSAILVAAIGLMGFASFTLVLWYGGQLIIRGDLTVGELTAFLIYLFALGGSIASLGNLYGGVRRLRGASARVFEILDRRPSVAVAGEAIELAAPRGFIALRRVSYRYPSAPAHRWALRDVELAIDPGQVVALVGPSGAGKSTLFSLLLRFADPTEGSVEIDGHDLRSLSLVSLRRSIAVVPQNIFLFTGTVAENIRYGDLRATEDQVRAAAEAAAAHEFIAKLPHGYSEVVGPRGVRLSAGQQQRIAIARAFLKNTAILLLDEATSSLDAESENLIRTSLLELMNRRTTLVIAHRLATAQRADRIAVLDDGRITALGSHEELARSSRLYRRYWELQSLLAAEPAR